MKKILILLLIMPALLFADAVIFSGNDVKALKGNLDLNGLAKILTTNGDPSTGAGLVAPQGSLALSLNTAKLYLKTGFPNTSWAQVRSGLVDLTSQVTGLLPLANGGTGSATRNFVDLTSSETIAGTKTFSSTIGGSISGNAATVTTNANLSGDVSSVGNTTSYSGIVPVNKGGTGSATQNFVDLSTAQTIAGVKTFSSTITGSISGNAATVTTNANLTGDVTSVGNATTYSGVVPVNKGGTGSATQNFVDLSTAQTVAGVKTFSSTISGSINGNAATVTTNANLTGAITSTGNATSLGSFTSSNLATALTNETGSGAAVFATSPTLTTPDIGAATGTTLALGGTINSIALLDLQSTTKVFFPPRMTSTQKTAITAVEGALVWDSTNHALYGYNGSGWVNSSVATGTPVVPGIGAGTNVDIFSVSYGATSSTVCSATSSTCAYVDSIGATASVSLGASAGLYTLTAPRTYSKLHCTANVVASGSGVAHVYSPLNCSSCNTLAISTQSGAGAAANTLGTIDCIGTY